MLAGQLVLAVYRHYDGTHGRLSLETGGSTWIGILCLVLVEAAGQVHVHAAVYRHYDGTHGRLSYQLK